jgi:hypothetical protein
MKAFVVLTIEPAARFGTLGAPVLGVEVGLPAGRVPVGVAVAAAVVAVGVVVAGGCVAAGVAVGTTGHPFRALITAVRISSTVIWWSLFASPASHSRTLAFPRAMFTIVRISSIVTAPLSLQSPTQELVGVPGVDVGVGVAVG